MSPVRWQLEGHKARFSLGDTSALIDAVLPEQGVSDLTIGGRTVEGQLLAVRFLSDDGPCHATLADAYVRTSDFVATYAQTESRPYRWQVYWRTHDRSSAPSALAALDLIVSVQTDLLDSHPEVHVTSILPATEIWRLNTSGKFVPLEVESQRAASLSRADGPGCLLLRLADTGGEADGPQLSYVEMIHPADFSQSILITAEDDRVQINHRLLADFLEKGVIRRARLRGVLLERSDDLEAAADWYQALMSAELPLAT